MTKILTEEQIKDILKEEKVSLNSYKDNFDLDIDVIIDLYETKKIDENTFKLFLSFILSVSIKETVLDLSNQMIKRNLHEKKLNKLFILNYSKENYA